MHAVVSAGRPSEAAFSRKSSIVSETIQEDDGGGSGSDADATPEPGDDARRRSSGGGDGEESRTSSRSDASTAAAARSRSEVADANGDVSHGQAALEAPSESFFF